MSDVAIRFCDSSLDRALIDFIRREWKPGHVLGRSKELLDWQYLDERRRRYNFVAGIDDDGGRLRGVLGFITASRYDAALSQSDTIWMALWKADADVPLLGLRLYQYLKQHVQCAVMACIGFNDDAKRIYESLGFVDGELRHYYMRNEDMARFSLIAGRGRSEEHREPRALAGDATLTPVSADEYPRMGARLQWVQDADVYPQKSVEYFHARYLIHPFYDYTAHFIERGGEVRGLLVTRTVEHEGARAIRVVDFYGPDTALRGLRSAFQGLLKAQDAEYIDFYNHGISAEAMAAAGFVPRGDADDVIVPNYYEPFVQKNASIRFAFTSLAGDCRFSACKGDGDQDRPNTLPLA